MTGVSAVSAVAEGADCDDGAVRRQRHRYSRLVVCGFAVNVISFLGPRCSVPFVDTDMTGVRAVSVRADCDHGAVRRQRRRNSRTVAYGFAVNVGSDLIKRR